MIRYASISKAHQEEFDAYVEKLGVTTEGEKFVLMHILERDWGRDILLQEIKTVKYNDKGCGGLVHVKCTTRNGSYSFSVSHLGGKGWITDDIEGQKRYISADLFHKMD